MQHHNPTEMEPSKSTIDVKALPWFDRFLHTADEITRLPHNLTSVDLIPELAAPPAGSIFDKAMKCYEGLASHTLIATTAYYGNGLNNVALMPGDVLETIAKHGFYPNASYFAYAVAYCYAQDVFLSPAQILRATQATMTVPEKLLSLSTLAGSDPAYRSLIEDQWKRTERETMFRSMCFTRSALKALLLGSSKEVAIASAKTDMREPTLFLMDSMHNEPLMDYVTLTRRLQAPIMELLGHNA